MSRPSVFIYRPVDASGESHRRLAEAGCDVTVGAADDSRAQIIARARNAQALMGSTFRAGVMGADFLVTCQSLRIISKYTIGVDDIDVDTATELGIVVTHCPIEANWGGVAEGTLGLMLGFLKKLRERDRAVKRGGWRSPELEGQYLGSRDDGYPGLTVGIVGLGRIGKRVADLLAPWRARLLACDPYVDGRVFERHNVLRVDLDTLLSEADVVTLHCNLTQETRRLLNAEKLALMKSTALLINTSRGAVVDLDALCDALDADRLAGAALDVFPEEPLATGARILGMGDKVILYPHMVAAHQGGTLHEAIPWATEATLAALRGQVPEHVYNTEVIPKWRTRFGDHSLL